MLRVVVRVCNGVGSVGVEGEREWDEGGWNEGKGNGSGLVLCSGTRGGGRVKRRRVMAGIEYAPSALKTDQSIDFVTFSATFN